MAGGGVARQVFGVCWHVTMLGVVEFGICAGRAHCVSFGDVASIVVFEVVVSVCSVGHVVDMLRERWHVCGVPLVGFAVRGVDLGVDCSGVVCGEGCVCGC